MESFHVIHGSGSWMLRRQEFRGSTSRTPFRGTASSMGKGLFACCRSPRSLGICCLTADSTTYAGCCDDVAQARIGISSPVDLSSARAPSRERQDSGVDLAVTLEIVGVVMSVIFAFGSRRQTLGMPNTCGVLFE
mmetsp:Transcript_17216/g.41457  ORF Transcript_17216/g.41457 Transcript_17216/m.41457 type:complete len:135 (+) Transcript_17216:1233-1637(+)